MQVAPVIHMALADTRTNFKKYKERASHLRGPFPISLVHSMNLDAFFSIGTFAW